MNEKVWRLGSKEECERKCDDRIVMRSSQSEFQQWPQRHAQGRHLDNITNLFPWPFSWLVWKNGTHRLPFVGRTKQCTHQVLLAANTCENLCKSRIYYATLLQAIQLARACHTNFMLVCKIFIQLNNCDVQIKTLCTTNQKCSLMCHQSSNSSTRVPCAKAPDGCVFYKCRHQTPFLVQLGCVDGTDSVKNDVQHFHKALKFRNKLQKVRKCVGNKSTDECMFIQLHHRFKKKMIHNQISYSLQNQIHFASSQKWRWQQDQSALVRYLENKLNPELYDAQVCAGLVEATRTFSCYVL